ncbi:MAG TPA: hypothetical protein VFW98_17675 [Gemmatimonadaceae bacterium]|nr:hypothetical protein [Gemmatimonadaceae bacterium]
MSLSTDVKNDIKSAQKWRLGWRGLLIVAVMDLPVFWLFDHFGRSNMMVPTGACIAVLGVVIAIKWKLRRHVWFWMVLAILAALHAVLLWYVPWPAARGAALAWTGVAYIDLWVLLWVFEAIGRLMEGRTTAER